MKKKRLVRGARNVALTTMLTAAPIVSTSLPIFSHAAHAAQAPSQFDSLSSAESYIFSNFYYDHSGFSEQNSKIQSLKGYTNLSALFNANISLFSGSAHSGNTTITNKLSGLTSSEHQALVNLLLASAELSYPSAGYSDESSFETAVGSFKSDQRGNFNTLFNSGLSPTDPQYINIDVLLKFLTDYTSSLKSILSSNPINVLQYDQTVQQAVSDALTNGANKADTSILNNRLSTNLGITTQELFKLQTYLNVIIDPDNVGRGKLISNVLNKKLFSINLSDGTVNNSQSISLNVPAQYSQYSSLVNDLITWHVSPAGASVTGGTFTATSPNTYTVKASIPSASNVAEVPGDITILSKSVDITSTSTGGGVVTGGTGGSTSDNNGDVNIDTGSNTSTETNSDGQKQVVVTVKSSDIENAVNNATDLKTITINVPNQSGSGATAAQVSLPAQAFDTVKAKNKNAQVQITSDQGTYSLPVNQIDTQALAKDLGVTNSSDVKINIQVKKTSDTNNVLTKNKLSNVSNVVEFSITATAGGKSKQLDQFNVYVKRSIPVGSTIDPTSVTGVRLNPDGSFTPVPTVVTNGQVSFLSRTNSKYTVVEHHASFTDIPKDYWAANFINTLGNKYIIHGKTDGSYAPRQATTRAQFAILLTKALGLTPTKAYDGKFKDVKGNEFYIKPLEAAVEAGLIKGKQDGTFDPNAPVTREEAAAMLNNALNFVGYDASQLDATKKLTDFKDSAKIGDWAKAAVTNLYEAGIFHGKEDQTFAARNSTKRDQMAVVLQKFLQFIKFSN